MRPNPACVSRMNGSTPAAASSRSIRRRMASLSARLPASSCLIVYLALERILSALLFDGLTRQRRARVIPQTAPREHRIAKPAAASHRQDIQRLGPLVTAAIGTAERNHPH